MSPVVLCIGLVLGAALCAENRYQGDARVTEIADTTRVLFGFVDSSEADEWLAVNDHVMGGVSKGKASPTADSCLLFSGSISLENKGGFASIRSQPTGFDLGGFQGIRIRVKGDGRRYQFRLRPGRDLGGIAFKHEFKTIENTWLEINLLFTSFIPTFRGRTVTDVKPLDAADIRQVGFLLADKTAGPFSLKVDSIVAFK